MIPFYVLAGGAYNQIARAVAAPVPGSADARLGDVAALSDAHMAAPFVFGTAAGTHYIDFDLSQVRNGSFAAPFSGGVPALGWSLAGTATATRVTSPAPPVGTHALDVGGGGATGNDVVYELLVASGETLTLEAYLYGLSATLTGAAEVWVRNLTTGHWWDGVAWAPGAGALAAHNLAEWRRLRATFQIEPYAITLADTCRLQVRLSGAGSGSQHAYYAQVALYPRVDFVSLHGHNIAPAQQPIELRSSPATPPTSPASTVRAQLTLAQPTMWARFVGADARYWRLSLGDPTDGRRVFLREVVFGQAVPLLEQREEGSEAVLVDVQDRSDSPSGPLDAYIRTARGRRRLACRFKSSTAEHAQWREIMERSRNGALPMVCVPDSAASSAMLCRVAPEWEHGQIRGEMSSSSVTLEELPFPALVG